MRVRGCVGVGVFVFSVVFASTEKFVRLCLTLSVVCVRMVM